MSHSLPEVTEESFERDVLASEVPVLLDFTATWCAPCRALTPILERIAAEKEGILRVASVDGDASPAIAARYGVRSFPTLLVLRKGEVVAKHVGLTTRARILEMTEVV